MTEPHGGLPGRPDTEPVPLPEPDPPMPIPPGEPVPEPPHQGSADRPTVTFSTAAVALIAPLAPVAAQPANGIAAAAERAAIV